MVVLFSYPVCYRQLLAGWGYVTLALQHLNKCPVWLENWSLDLIGRPGWTHRVLGIESKYFSNNVIPCLVKIEAENSCASPTALACSSFLGSILLGAFLNLESPSYGLWLKCLKSLLALQILTYKIYSCLLRKCLPIAFSTLFQYYHHWRLYGTGFIWLLHSGYGTFSPRKLWFNSRQILFKNK